MRYTVTIYDEVGTIIYQLANVLPEKVSVMVESYVELTQYQCPEACWSLSVKLTAGADFDKEK